MRGAFAPLVVGWLIKISLLFDDKLIAKLTNWHKLCIVCIARPPPVVNMSAAHSALFPLSHFSVREMMLHSASPCVRLGDSLVAPDYSEQTHDNCNCRNNISNSCFHCFTLSLRFLTIIVYIKQLEMSILFLKK